MPPLESRTGPGPERDDEPACEECLLTLQRLYEARPGLTLTVDQAAAMLGVCRKTSAEALLAAVHQRLLRCTSLGQYVRR